MPNDPISQPTESPSQSPSPAQAAKRSRALRLVAVAGAIVAFLGLASVINPASSTAVTLGPSAEDPSAVLLGTLECDRFLVRMYGTHDGDPRYSVFDTAGREIGLMLTAEEMYRIDPILDPATWLATPMGEVEIGDDY